MSSAALEIWVFDQMRQSAQSTEYLEVTVDVDIDPTGFEVDFAFPEIGIAPIEGDWKAGSWQTAGGYVARILIGPNGDLNLSPGEYDGWIRVQGTPEHPVRKLDRLFIEA